MHMVAALGLILMGKELLESVEVEMYPALQIMEQATTLSILQLQCLM